MAVILIMDRAVINGRRKPRIRAVHVDGYLLYVEQDKKETMCTWMDGIVRDKGITALGLAEKLAQAGIGKDVAEQIKRQLVIMARAEREKKKAEQEAAKG